MTPSRCVLVLSALAVTGCDSLDVWVDRCLAAGTCREELPDGGLSLDAGRLRPITCADGVPTSAPYADQVAAEWACVRDDLLASRIAGTQRRTGVLPGQASVFDADLTALKFDGGAGFAGGVLLPDGRVFGLPGLRRAVLVIPPDGTPPTVVSLNAVPAVMELRATSGGVLSPEGDVILCPGARAVFARITPTVSNGELTAVAYASAQPLTSRWDGCVVAPGLGVFAFPSVGDQVLHLPFDGGAPEAWPLRSDGGASGAALLPTGNLVAIPKWPSTTFIVVNPVTRIERAFRHQVKASDTGPATQLGRAVMSLDGRVLALPEGMSGRYVVNLDSDGTTSEGFRNAPAITSGGALSPAGDIFLAPSENSVVPAFDGETGVTAIVPPDAVGRDFTSGYAGAVTRLDGTIVFIPSSGSEVLIVRPRARRALSAGTVTSPFFNRY